MKRRRNRRPSDTTPASENSTGRLARSGRLLGVVLLAAAVAGCQSVPRNAVPEQLVGHAKPMGEHSVRFWGDTLPPDIDEIVRDKYDQTRAARPELVAPGARPTLSFLAISGGGSDGAFGAGLLAGWTESGTRPEFEIVTGISTGALTAPLAFLGPAYDGQLKEIYTRYSNDDLVQSHPLAGIIGINNSLTSNAPLRRVLSSYVDEEMLAAVAREHYRGRRLLIGTTDIDAQRPVVWDMGRIATSGRPDALKLFRDVLIASASIPGVFPPVTIRVAVGDGSYEELHVDGGATHQVFLLPPQFTAHQFDAMHDIRPTRRLYIIRNGRIYPEYKIVEANTMGVASRSISTLIKTQGVGDLYELHDLARKNQVDYNLAVIPEDFPDTSTEAFDKPYMNALYELGYRLGRAGYNWQKSPLLEASE